MGLGNNIADWFKAAGGRLGSLSVPARLLAVLLVGAAAIGGIWLVNSLKDAAMVPVLSRPVGADELSAAQETLRRQGIAHEASGRGILVARADLPQALAALKSKDIPGRDTGGSFEQMLGENDIWRTEAQNAKRWQAAKMASLSRLIGQFSAVRSAAVIFEPSRAGRLGRAAVAATAAVNVTLADETTMTAELIGAIADMVSGSIAGLARQEVRIVDSNGRSYRAGDPGSRPAAASRLAAAQKLLEAEQAYATKIRQMLHYIEGVIVTVNIEPLGDGMGPISIAVSMPRSYLVAAHRAVGGQAELTGDQLDETAGPQLARVQQSVMRLIGLTEPGDVNVEWHYDAPTSAELRRVDRSQGNWLAGNEELLAGGVLVALCLAAAVALARRRRALNAKSLPRDRAVSAELASQQSPPTDQQQPKGDQDAGDLFAFLQDVPSENIAAAIKDDRGQAIAMILARLSAGKAAAVLALLGRECQVEVVRRMAELGAGDQEVLREVHRGLAMRLGELRSKSALRQGAVGQIVEILHHAGWQTERTVLAGLGPDRPALAKAIQKRIFAFGDIADLPADRLQPALASIDCDELAIALRTAGREVSKKIFSALPSSAARQLRRQMDQIGPVRLSDVEAAQQQVAESVRQSCGGTYIPAGSPAEALTPGRSSD